MPPPTLDAKVAGDDAINAREKDAGVQLAGTGEVGATVRMVLGADLANAASLTKTFDAVVGGNGRYSLNLSAGDLFGLADGPLQVQLTQKDLAGNVSGPSYPNLERILTLKATPLASGVTLEAVSADNSVSLSEQNQTLTLQGTSPAQTAVRVRLEGLKGTLELSAAPSSTSGVWSLGLSPAQMQTLGSGQVRLLVWAEDAVGNSTPVLTKSVVLEGAVPAPYLISRFTGPTLNGRA